MDDITYSVFEKMRLKNVKLILLGSFEDDTLRKVKRERTFAEYCFTCTSPLVIYVMKQESQAAHVAYLDADLFFYSNPQPFYDELGGSSILIIGHRFSPEYKSQESTSGIYNVGMVIFRNDHHGMECLKWWKEQCIESCRFNTDAAQCGDQKYLDDWPAPKRDRYSGKGFSASERACKADYSFSGCIYRASSYCPNHYKGAED